ncbi:hypothetical protein GKQ23_13120 [Erwinia sp. E602]|uniref:hypothetical protein n=1 Tax=Erwinia sp. E602 TaxID=2675378 RepID=UPI001BAD1B8F|nr:hypothetical protein [Erwinia sp. E602]QUG75875.1 hypothetical protein GKQ23_13120 [Erwinia sp. E602]
MTEEEMKNLIMAIREQNDTENSTMEILAAVLKAKHSEKQHSDVFSFPSVRPNQ